MATATEIDSIQSLDAILDDLGGISPGRVLLKKTREYATEEDLVRLNGSKVTICELVDGLLVEKALEFSESVLALALGGYLRAFIIPRNQGIVSGAAGMMRLQPGLVRVPDIAFTSWDRIPGRRRPTGAVAGFSPDLAVEVLSQGNTRGEMARKRREYFANGVRLVWEVDPVARTVAVYEDPENATVLEESQTMVGDPVLPGFALALADLFGELDRQGA